jgi:hypothetical protein
MLSRLLTLVHAMDFDKHEKYVASSDGAFVTPVAGRGKVVTMLGRCEVISHIPVDLHDLIREMPPTSYEQQNWIRSSQHSEHIIQALPRRSVLVCIFKDPEH